MRRRRGKAVAMPKARNEDRERYEYKAYETALETLGIEPKDPKHPLAEYPPTRLKSAVSHITGTNDEPGFKRFVSVFTKASGSGVEPRMVSEWLRDSRGITAYRLAQVLDIIVWYAIDTGSSFALESSGGLGSYFDDLDTKTDYLSVYESAVSAVFGVAHIDSELAKQAALMAAIPQMEGRQLEALYSVSQICREAYVEIVDSPEECAALTLERIEIARVQLEAMDARVRSWAEAFATDDDGAQDLPFN